MQITKNEKIVQVVQEETYDIKGLTKAEAIALLIVINRTNGSLLCPVHKALESTLGEKYEDLGFELRTTSGDYDSQDVLALESKINKLAQE